MARTAHTSFAKQLADVAARDRLAAQLHLRVSDDLETHLLTILREHLHRSRGLVTEMEVESFVHFSSLQFLFHDLFRKFPWAEERKIAANGSKRTASSPVASRRRSFSGVGVSSFKDESGRRMRAGCGSKVTAIAFAPITGARRTISQRTCACARCTPSKFPAVTTVGPKPGGMSSSLWKICI